MTEKVLHQQDSRVGQQPPAAPAQVQPKPPPGRRGRPLWIKMALVGLLLAGMGVIAVARLGPGNGAPVVDPDAGMAVGDATTAAPEGAELSAKAAYGIGETARTGSLDVTVLGSKDPHSPGKSSPPKAGYHYVSVDVELSNRTGDPRTFSSTSGLHMVDDAYREYRPTVTDAATSAPSEIRPGQSVRTSAVFEIPDGSTGLRLRVQADGDGAEVFFTLS
jgi:hypothetical protein